MVKKQISDLTVETLEKHHKRADFSCGEDALDRYIKQQASQDQKRRISAPFILVDKIKSQIAGYYTLSMTSIALNDIPEKTAKKLPKYPLIPAVLLGRLAIDERYKGKKLGEYLLLDAMKRSLDNSSEVAAYCLVVDAKDDKAKSFYKKYGFIEMVDNKYRLFIPMKTIEILKL